MPVGVGASQRRGGAWIGAEVQQHERRRSPMRPVSDTGSGPDEATQPGRGGTCHCHPSIARTRDDRNRHEARDSPPVSPQMELGEIVRTHDPDETAFGIAPNEARERVGRETRAESGFDIRYLYNASPGHFPCRGKARRIGCHAVGGLQGIARGDEPPNVIKGHRLGNEQADAPVADMGRVERSAQKAGERQGRTCPVPRTSHLYVVSPSSATGPRA